MTKTHSLRPATGEDYDYLYSLFVITMRDSIIQVWGSWDASHWAAFFRDHFDPAHYQIVVVDGLDIGALSVEWRPDELYLDTIEIAPEYQGRGLGTAIIQSVLQESRARSLPVTLQVNHANPSRRLYERLGFTEIGRTETHFRMRAPATC